MLDIVWELERMLAAEHAIFLPLAVLVYIVVDTILSFWLAKNLFLRIALRIGEWAAIFLTYENLIISFPVYEVLIEDIAIVLIFFIILIVILNIVEAVIREVYRRAVEWYWLRQFEEHGGESTGLDLEHFRKLMIMKRMIDRQEFWEDLPGMLLTYPHIALKWLVHVTGSETLDSLQYRLAVYTNLVRLRGRLDSEGESEGKDYWIHVESCDWKGDFAIIRVTYSNYALRKLTKVIQWNVSTFFGVEEDSIIIQKESRGRVKAVVQVPSRHTE